MFSIKSLYAAIAVSVCVFTSHPVVLLAASTLQYSISTNQKAVDSTNLFLPNQAQPQLISDQFSFTEGPSVDRKGNLFFTDQPNNKIWMYSTRGEIKLFKEGAGRANGTYVDQDNNLITCSDEHNQLWSVHPDSKVTVLVSNLNGKHLNGPNDLWISKKGDIYFTDPYYQRDYWTRQQSELDGQKVYKLSKGSQTPVVVVDDLRKPNGIVGTADGKYVFVADIEANKTYKYQIFEDGRLVNKQLFINKGADGITLDNQGNLYLAGNGVTIVNPVGQIIAHIPVPQPWAANVCFGGKNKNILFITASKALYMLPMNVHGIE